MSDTSAVNIADTAKRFGIPREHAKTFVTVKKVLEMRTAKAVKNLEDYFEYFGDIANFKSKEITAHDVHTANRTLAVMLAIMQRDEHFDAGQAGAIELQNKRAEQGINVNLSVAYQPAPVYDTPLPDAIKRRLINAG